MTWDGSLDRRADVAVGPWWLLQPPLQTSRGSLADLWRLSPTAGQSCLLSFVDLYRLFEEHPERPWRDAVRVVHTVAGAFEAFGPACDRLDFNPHDGRIGVEVQDVADSKVFSVHHADHAPIVPTQLHRSK